VRKLSRYTGLSARSGLGLLKKSNISLRGAKRHGNLLAKSRRDCFADAHQRALATALIVVILSVALLPVTINARALYDPSQETQDSPTLTRVAVGRPFISTAVHVVGQLSMIVSNTGTFGTGFIDNPTGPDGGRAPSAEYPINSGIEYLFAGALWIGAVIGRDTVVSTGADGWRSTGREFNPASLNEQIANGEELKTRSISNPEDPEFFLAKSQEDITSVYFDTLTEGLPADQFNTNHVPLGIKVRETTYGWSYDYADDFVLFDYKITNISSRTLEKVYMGIYVDGDVGHNATLSNGQGAQDDICGFRLAVDQLNLRKTKCDFTDTVRIAWIADNDGSGSETPFVPPTKSSFVRATDPTSVTGTRVVRTPSDSLDFSFNWWVSNGLATLDFGPRLRGTEDDPFRDFGGFLGTPEGDKNKYYIMRHEEFDYDQLFSSVDLTSQGWLPPGPQSSDISNGFDTRYLLSFGPFIVFPGETLPITFAYVAGGNFHADPQAMNDLFSGFRPETYAEQLNFKELGTNAQWASWIYDNPGVDTDGDGFYGKFRICVNDSSAIDSVADTFYNDDSSLIDSIIPREFFTDVDTIFFEGDGVPDFRGASPPPEPVVRLEPLPGRIIVRWNGLRSETTPDPFSDALDFEGYRVYSGLDNRMTDMVMQSSYDKENYTHFFFNIDTEVWEIAGPPQTLQEIRLLYANNNPDYDPLDNGISSPLTLEDSLFYFIAQDFNRDDLADSREIHRPARYRDAPYPHTLNIDSAFTADTFLVDEFTGVTTFYPGGELTEDGKYFKYFEYEYALDNLLSSQRYFVSVTAFDFGAPESGLAALETSPLFNAVSEYPQYSTDSIVAKNLGVVVYPNPYRVDGNYRDAGFEGRGQSEFPDERVRAINFTNLPPVCSISIYSLDGDLIRQFEHNTAPNSPESMHDSWDLVTRNIQLIVSGIYFWTVEEPDGKVQMGKFVVIM
jgi:hypothetical protein